MNDTDKMQKEVKLHIPPVTKALVHAFYEYMSVNFKDGVHVDLVLNLIVNVHMSSMAALMRGIAEKKPAVRENVEIMLENMAETLRFKKMKSDGSIVN